MTHDFFLLQELRNIFNFLLVFSHVKIPNAEIAQASSILTNYCMTLHYPFLLYRSPMFMGVNAGEYLP
jgi:hypothetical protein